MTTGVSLILWSFALMTMGLIVIMMSIESKQQNCKHNWRGIYGDEINAAGCRAICRKCGKRSQVPEPRPTPTSEP